MTILDKFNLKDRVAVVTGGGGQLGFEFCKTLAEAGAAVVAADLNMDFAGKTAARLTEAGYSAMAFPLDVTRIESTRELVAETVKQFGSLDILVNSAALDPKFDPTASEKGIAPGAFEDYPLADWQAALNVNLTGMFLTTQACVKQMVAQGKKGSIINICSTYGLNGPDQRIYIKDGNLAAGKFYDLIQWTSKGAKHDGYVADKRVMEGGKALIDAKGEKKGDEWVVIFTRKLSGGEGDITMAAGKTYNIGFAIHDDHASGRFHHVSLNYTLGIDAKADITAAKQ